MWNQGKNCMGRRAFRKSNKSMQLGLKHHGTHYVEVLFLDPWQCTFLLPNFPNPHQDECAQLCPIILKIYAKFSKSPSGRVSTHESQICLNNNLKECFWWLSWRNLIRNGRLRDSNVAKWMYSCKSHPRSLPWHTAYAKQNLLLLCPKTAPCPEAATQATTTAAAADHCKAFPKPLRAGFWLAAILTRSERGANEVQTRSEIRFWETDPLSLLTNSLVAKRFRILFITVRLKRFQRWSRRGNQAKQQLQARARREKRRQRASKGDRGETEGRQRDASLANKYTIATTFIFGSIVGKPKKIWQVSVVCLCEVPKNTSVS